MVTQFLDQFAWFDGPPMPFNYDRYSVFLVLYYIVIIITYCIADIGIGIASGLFGAA